MKWFKENPFLAGLVLVVIIGVGVLGYFVSQAMSQYQQTSDEYAAAAEKLHKLQNHPPFPNDENLQKIRKTEDAYKSAIEQFRTDLSKMQLPLRNNVKPQTFQDDLRAAVNDTKSKAEAAGVTLPQGFYLGFDQYQNSLPSEHAAPALARELLVIKQIVNGLIGFKVRSIDDLKRMSLPEEGPATAANGDQGGPNKREQRRENRENGGALISRNPIEIAFTAEQAKFRVAFNSLLNSEQFLIVRNIMVQNTNPVGPPVKEAAAAAAAAPAENGEAAGKSLNVILGRELVRVALRLEIVNVTPPETAKK